MKRQAADIGAVQLFFRNGSCKDVTSKNIKEVSLSMMQNDLQKTIFGKVSLRAALHGFLWKNLAALAHKNGSATTAKAAGA